jgi:hypothetical protein
MGLTRSDVEWCYQTLLARAPESDALIEHLINDIGDWRNLVQRLVDSAEFKDRMTNEALVASRRMPDIDGFSYSDDFKSADAILGLLRPLRPYSVARYEKIRVGGQYDGGYVMVDDFAGLQGAYSLGINNDVAWDLAMAKRGIDIYQYDHTIAALPEENKHFHWKKIGIAERTDLDNDLAALADLMRLNGHTASSDLILKCDIEGAEWGMFATMPEWAFRTFRQIVVEIHGINWVNNAPHLANMQAAIANLTRHHKLVHVHANNNAAYSIVGGVPIPAALELTLVRADRYELSPSTETFPTALDAACFSGRVDYALGAFTF